MDVSVWCRFFTFLAGNVTFTAAGCVLPRGTIKTKLVISQIFLACFRCWNYITLGASGCSALTSKDFSSELGILKKIFLRNSIFKEFSKEFKYFEKGLWQFW
jgi:hypothetical protein